MSYLTETVVLVDPSDLPGLPRRQIVRVADEAPIVRLLISGEFQGGTASQEARRYYRTPETDDRGRRIYRLKEAPTNDNVAAPEGDEEIILQTLEGFCKTVVVERGKPEFVAMLQEPLFVELTEPPNATQVKLMRFYRTSTRLAGRVLYQEEHREKAPGS